MKKIIAAVVLTITASSVFAHGGGLNGDGCHWDYANDDYHCHK